MHEQPEPSSSDATAAGEDEILDGGSGPRWLRPSTRERPPNRGWRIGYALAAVIVAVALIRQLDSSTSAADAARRSGPPVSGSPSPDSASALAPDLAETAALPGPIQLVRALADRAADPVDLVRQDTPAGQCAVVAPGVAPTTSVLRAAARILGPARLIDAQRTLDGATGLCALSIRARLGPATLTISVASPGLDRGRSTPVVTTGVDGAGAGSAEYAMAHTSRGWDVLIGAVGNRGALPAVHRLAELAVSDAVTW